MNYLIIKSNVLERKAIKKIIKFLSKTNVLKVASLSLSWEMINYL